MKLRFLILPVLGFLFFSCNAIVATSSVSSSSSSSSAIAYKVEGTIGTTNYSKSGYFVVRANNSTTFTDIMVAENNSDFTNILNMWSIGFNSLSTGTLTYTGTTPSSNYYALYRISSTDYYASSNIVITVSNYDKSVNGIIEGTASGKMGHVVNGSLVESDIDFSLTFKVKITDII
jgi:hypothetical protein